MQAIADIVIKIGQDNAHNLVGEVAVMLMQRMDKTDQDRAVIAKLLVTLGGDGSNC